MATAASLPPQDGNYAIAVYVPDKNEGRGIRCGAPQRCMAALIPTCDRLYPISFARVPAHEKIGYRTAPLFVRSPLH